MTFDVSPAALARDGLPFKSLGLDQLQLGVQWPAPACSWDPGVEQVDSQMKRPRGGRLQKMRKGVFATARVSSVSLLVKVMPPRCPQC